MNFYLKYGKEKIKLANKPFAGGGEGNLYKILSPQAYKNYVAKIYHPLKRTKERADKINYLYQYPPEGLNKEQHPAYIWVHDVLEDQNKGFMGFIMPFVKGEKLEILCTPKLPKKLSSAWKRFDPRAQKSFELRLKLCFNIAAAVYHVHSTKRYVIVDLKPENIIIQPNGLVSLVDMDSVEVMEEDRVIFQAPVATPEYTPVEHYTNKSRLHSEDAIDPSWDLFALATIFYKLLFGIHPFAASAKPPYDQLVSLHQKIEHGLFVHHPEQKPVFNIIPPPHKRFYQLNDELQQLFMLTFVDGHEEADARPLAEEWCIALLNTFGDEKMKAHFQDLLLMRGSSVGSMRKPSRLVALPKLRLKEEAHIKGKYHQYLQHISHKKQVVQKLSKMGVNSILQIERIDHLRSQLELKDERVILLDQVSDTTIALASKLGDWFVKIRKLLKEQQDEINRIKRFYEHERKNLNKEKEEQLTKFKQEQEAVQGKADLAYKQIKIKAIMKEYDVFFQSLENKKLAYQEALEQQTASYKLRYEALIQEVKEMEAAEATAVRQLEENFKQQTQSKLKEDSIEKIRLDSLVQMKLVQDKLKAIQKAEKELQQL